MSALRRPFFANPDQTKTKRPTFRARFSCLQNETWVWILAPVPSVANLRKALTGKAPTAVDAAKALLFSPFTRSHQCTLRLISEFSRGRGFAELTSTTYGQHIYVVDIAALKQWRYEEVVTHLTAKGYVALGIEHNRPQTHSWWPSRKSTRSAAPWRLDGRPPVNALTHVFQRAYGIFVNRARLASAARLVRAPE